MKMKVICLILGISFLLGGCGRVPFPPASPTAPQTVPTTAMTQSPETTAPTVPQETTEPPATVPATTAPVVTEPLHSEFHIPGLDVEDVILYFNEICLDAEFVNGGNATLLQKWDSPIYYMIHGDATEKDLMVLEGFMAWLNGIEGFPGFIPTDAEYRSDLNIYFCTEQEMLNRLGDNFYGCDGGVTFWYDGNNAIYDAIICYRTDLDQETRNSVILEEIYNGLGPVQDTWLREDSIVYAGYSTPQTLTEIDELILKLLYHPMMQCGMNAEECEAVIRQLYY